MPTTLIHRSSVRPAIPPIRRCLQRTAVRACALLGTLLPAAAFAAEPAHDKQLPPQNSPPRWSSGSDYPYTVRVGETVEVMVGAEDADKDPITFKVSTSLACTTNAESQGSTAFLRLKCKGRGTDVGENEIHVDASDGTHTIQKTVQVNVVDESEAYFLPGAAYSLLDPRLRSRYGTFQGFDLQIVFASWIHRNDKYGPSHGRVYLDMSVLRSSREEVGGALDFAFGFDLSLERNPQRRFFLPYFGLRTGAFVSNALGDRGALAHVTPLAGVHVYADRSIYLGAWAGYFMPLSGAHFDDLGGLRLQAGASFTLW